MRDVISNAAIAGAKAARRFTALLLFLLYSGYRLTETLRIRPADIDAGSALHTSARPSRALPGASSSASRGGARSVRATSRSRGSRMVPSRPCQQALPKAEGERSSGRDYSKSTNTT